MYFRVRTSLTERPGALARLATRCGDAGLNILGLQILPDLGRVTDELVISAPQDWTARAVAELVSGAGGDEVSVEPCTTHDLIDQPTRWLAAVGTASPPPAPSSATPVEYAATTSGVVARVAGHVVGVAAFTLGEGRELSVEVAPAWRRLGIGTALVLRAAARASASGEDEIVLVAPADDEGFVPMVCGTGLRARIRTSGGLLTARMVVSGVRRQTAATARAGEDPVTSRS